MRALNGNLPADVRVLASDAAAEGFDARRDATSRAYAYRLHTRRVPSPFERGRALHWPHRIDREALDASARLVCGSHDFTAFTRAETTHRLFRRSITRAEWVEPGPDQLELRIEAPSFMRNQVRILVGTMLEVASGRRTLADFERLLGGAPREQAGETARPHGLYLVSVRY